MRNSAKEKLLIELKQTIQKAKSELRLTEEQILSLFREEEQQVPISIFSTDLGPLEALVKFLKENKKLKYSEIAEKLGRDQRTIWATYNDAKKNLRQKFRPDFDLTIPLEIFSDRKIGVLEHLVLYLKETRKFSVSEIAKILKRNSSTVWATYYNARKKTAEKKSQKNLTKLTNEKK